MTVQATIWLANDIMINVRWHDGWSVLFIIDADSKISKQLFTSTFLPFSACDLVLCYENTFIIIFYHRHINEGRWLRSTNAEDRVGSDSASLKILRSSFTLNYLKTSYRCWIRLGTSKATAYETQRYHWAMPSDIVWQHLATLCFSTHLTLSVYHFASAALIYFHTRSVGHCVCMWLCISGCEDSWGRKHKLQAGLLLLALRPTSDTLLICSEAHNCRLARPHINDDVKTHSSIHNMAHKYQY